MLLTVTNGLPSPRIKVSQAWGRGVGLFLGLVCSEDVLPVEELEWTKAGDVPANGEGSCFFPHAWVVRGGPNTSG